MGRITSGGEPRRVNTEIGGKLRMRRQALGLTQTELASCMGISFQQIQKYEDGRNAMSPERLLAAAEALNVSVHYFFDDLEATGTVRSQESSAFDLERRDLRDIRLLRMVPDDHRSCLMRLAAALAVTSVRSAIDGVVAELQAADRNVTDPVSAVRRRSRKSRSVRNRVQST
jgi:transcriptional regulator with XRE-family HTH domain